VSQLIAHGKETGAGLWTPQDIMCCGLLVVVCGSFAADYVEIIKTLKDSLILEYDEENETIRLRENAKSVREDSHTTRGVDSSWHRKQAGGETDSINRVHRSFAVAPPQPDRGPGRPTVAQGEEAAFGGRAAHAPTSHALGLARGPQLSHGEPKPRRQEVER
jgi:hypothetical protein